MENDKIFIYWERKTADIAAIITELANNPNTNKVTSDNVLVVMEGFLERSIYCNYVFMKYGQELIRYIKKEANTVLGL